MFNLKLYLKIITKYLNNLKWTIQLSYENFKWTILIGYYNFKWTILIGYYNFKWTILNKFKYFNFLLKKRFKSLKKTIKKRFKTLKWNIKTTFRTLKWNIKTTFKFLYYKIHLLYKKLNIILYNIRLSLLIEVQLNTRWVVKIIYIDIFMITTVIIYFIFVIALPMWKAAVHLPVFHLGEAEPGACHKVNYLLTPTFMFDFNHNYSQRERWDMSEGVLVYTTDPRRNDPLLYKLGGHFANYFRHHNSPTLNNVSIYDERWSALGDLTDPRTIVLTKDDCEELAYRLQKSPHGHRYVYTRDAHGVMRICRIQTPTTPVQMDSYLLDAAIKSYSRSRS